MPQCNRCHRPLRNAKSIERGMGPVCAKRPPHWAKLGQDSQRQEQLDELLASSCPEEIVCSRINGVAQVNVPQQIVYHSPTGFEWGYGGSGPADLALNILALFTDKETAFRLHQRFKWEFVAPMAREGGVIRKADIVAWLKAHGVCPEAQKEEAQC